MCIIVLIGIDNRKGGRDMATQISIPAHVGYGDGDYLWDFGVRRGQHRSLQIFIDEICGRDGMAASFDDDPSIIQGGYIEAETTISLTPRQIRRAQRLGIIVTQVDDA